VGALANYQQTYGTIGAAIVALLWFYVSGIALLLGAEMNALIEHNSPEGKDPGEKVAGEKEAAVSHGFGAPAPTRRLPPVPTIARRSRTSELVIGGAALVAELAAVIAMHVRRIKARS